MLQLCPLSRNVLRERSSDLKPLVVPSVLVVTTLVVAIKGKVLGPSTSHISSKNAKKNWKRGGEKKKKSERGRERERKKKKKTKTQIKKDQSHLLCSNWIQSCHWYVHVGTLVLSAASTLQRFVSMLGNQPIAGVSRTLLIRHAKTVLKMSFRSSDLGPRQILHKSQEDTKTLFWQSRGSLLTSWSAPEAFSGLFGVPGPEAQVTFSRLVASRCQPSPSKLEAQILLRARRQTLAPT